MLYMSQFIIILHRFIDLLTNKVFVIAFARGKQIHLSFKDIHNLHPGDDVFNTAEVIDRPAI